MYNNSNRPIVNINLKIAIGKLRELNNVNKLAVIDKVVREQFWTVLGPKRNIGDHWGLTPVYNLTFDSSPEIEKLLLDKENVIQITIICYDSYSGSAFVTRRKYENNEILEGNFSYGLNFNRIKENYNSELDRVV